MKILPPSSIRLFAPLTIGFSLGLPPSFAGPAPAAIVADHTRIGTIPEAAINLAKSTLHIAYGHTSHGSQLVTGLNSLAASNSIYRGLDLRDRAMGGNDVGYYPAWVNETRSYLGTPNPVTGRGTSQADLNVIIWSWCGQASGYTEQNMIEHYLTPMTQLEKDYPGIKFVYMTGHLDGSGTSGNLNQRNNQIRAYCAANHKVLFDFADIESYDPAGNEFLSKGATDACDYSGGNWASEWFAAHPDDPLTILSGTCGDCAHSHTLNCVLKARAAWWLLGRLAGWSDKDRS